jgi:hypothetical protein
MEMTRMAFSMLALAMATMPRAVSSTGLPIARASRETAAKLRPGKIFIRPPRKNSGSRRPRQRLASVTAGRSPLP